MTDRNAILARLKSLQTYTPRPEPPPPRPAVGDDLVAELVQRMTACTVVVVQLADTSAVPAWVASYLVDNALPPQLVVGADPAMFELPWQQASLVCEQRAANADDPVAMSCASCAIAESGTLLLQSGPDNPTTLNFLPDHHLVVLSRHAIVSHWEEAWTRCRVEWRGQLPRALNFISGPSSTADVGLTQVFGAHGPRNLSVLIVDDYL
jgi:L-lactate dehydrogenase complex protein LldG